MDIIDVLIGELESGINKCLFEMNACLVNPSDSASLDRLRASSQKYSELYSQLRVLKELSSQAGKETHQEVKNED